MAFTVGDEVLYETVAGDLLCVVVELGPRLMRIQLPDGQRRTVSPMSVLRVEDEDRDG